MDGCNFQKVVVPKEQEGRSEDVKFFRHATKSFVCGIHRLLGSTLFCQKAVTHLDSLESFAGSKVPF